MHKAHGVSRCHPRGDIFRSNKLQALSLRSCRISSSEEPVIKAWQELVAANAGWLLLGSLGGLVIGLLLTPILVTRIPPDYFLYRRRHSADRRYPVLNLILLVVKNVIGAAFVLAGLLLLFLPGQGLITLFSLAINAVSCMDSREIFSGRSSESTTPFRKRSHSGNKPLAFGWMSTFLQ